MTDEELDRALAPQPWVAQPPQQEALRRRTEQYIRPRGRWLTWSKSAVVFVAGVTVGILLGRISQPTPRPALVAPPQPSPAENSTLPTSQPPATPLTPPSPGLSTPSDTNPSPPTFAASESVFDPVKVELQAELADTREAAELYRQLGDYYLQRGDIRSASRCYRLHLKNITPEELAYTERDSWYLNALKSIRRREN